MRRCLAGAVALATLVGCAPLPLASPAPAGPVSAITATSYRLEGRLSVRAAEQQFAGGIVWTRQGEEQEILLRTPLGQGVAEVRLGPAGASLTDSEGKVYQAEAGETLLQQALGLTLPLAGLSYWLRGQPDPARPFSGLPDGLGGWSSLEQDGWRIEYGSALAGTGLPGRLVARRADELEIRLVVDAWLMP